MKPRARWLAGGLVVHALQGGAFETRTVAAMTVRAAFWFAQSLVLLVLLRGAASPEVE